MAAEALPLDASTRLYLQLTLPGVPWYIYNDHADGYYRCDKADASALAFDLALDQSTGGILLGGADITLTRTTAPGESAPENQEWKDLEGARGWHHSLDDIDSFVAYASRVDPAEYFRTVKLQAQYAVHETEGDGYELKVKVRSIIGAGTRDLNTEYGRDQVPEDKGLFRLVLGRKNGAEEEEEGWMVSAMEGVDGMKALPA
jgi:hypothetical protein